MRHRPHFRAWHAKSYGEKLELFLSFAGFQNSKVKATPTILPVFICLMMNLTCRFIS